MKQKLHLLLAVLFFTTFTNAQTTRYVKTAAAGSADGSSWANASGNLQTIINASVAGDLIFVNKGTYIPTEDPFGNATPSKFEDVTFYLKEGVKIYGGFDEANGIIDLTHTRIFGDTGAILSGDLNSDDVVSGGGTSLNFSNNFGNAAHVVVSVSDTNATVLNGFTIKGGNARNTGAISVESKFVYRNSGAGIANVNSSPTLVNIIFKENSASNDGGAVYNFNATSLKIINVTFSKNKASDGGAMASTSSSPSVINAVFSNNLAVKGGAIYNDTGSTPSLINTTFYNNAASTNGGAIYNFFSTTTVRNSVFWENKKNTSNSSSGSDIENSGQTVNISYCATQQNSSYSSGTGIINNQDPLFTNSSSEDFSLQTNSPLQNSGNNSFLNADIQDLNANGNTTETIPFDILGNNRVEGSTVDIGAYEILIPPTVTAFSPVDEALNVIPTNNLQIIFSEAITKGTGDITIFNVIDDSVFETINVASSNISVSGSTVTINPIANVLAEKSYYVQIANTAFKNNSNTNFEGIIDTTTWNFTTQEAVPPTFENSTPAITSVQQTEINLSVDIDEAGKVYYVILPDNAIAPTISEVKSGTGNAGTTTIKFGSTTITSGDFDDTITIADLSPVTAYDIYIVAEDDSPTPNTQATVTKLDLTTSGLQQWYKANDGLTKNASNEVTAWVDQSSFATAATPNGIPKQTNSINFNPAITFNNGASSVQYFGIDLSSIDNSDYELFVVAKRINSNGGNYVLGTSPQAANKALHLGYSTNTTLKLGHFANDLNISNSSSFNSPEISPVILHGTLDTTVGKKLAELKRGTLTSSSDASTAPLSGLTNGFIGIGFNGNNEFQGDIAEVIVYNTALSDTEINKIYSYLAIKYGLTLDNTGGNENGDYVANDGVTVLWDASENTTYHNDITAIARDNNAGLHQSKSKSEHSDAIITLEKTGGITNDNNAIVIGNNNQTFAFSSANSPLGLETSDRIWKMQKTGTLDNITISLNVSGNSGVLVDYQLLVKTTDTNFTSGTSVYNATSISGDTISFANISTVNNSYFTIAEQVLEITTLSPTDDATNVALDSNLEITFSKNVVKGSGNITIYDASLSNLNIIETIAVTSSNVTIVNNVVTINPTNDFDYNQEYYVQIDNTAFKDNQNTNFGGILDTTTWSFSTVTNSAPTFTSIPITTATIGSTYEYNVTVSDTDGDNLNLTTPTLPSWLTSNTAVKVRTLAGSGTYGFVNGTGTSAQFTSLSSVAVDSAGNIYVADANNNSIRKITPAGVVSTLTGSSTYGFVNGTLAEARFRSPSGVAIDNSDNIYVADTNNHSIRKITPSGQVTTLAGSGSFGATDATGTVAQFNFPQGVAVDNTGNVYVADRNNHKIRKITPVGLVTTLAGSSSGYNDATGTSAQFNLPWGITTDNAGNVYVADRNNFRIRKITPSGVVTTFAGSGSSGATDGTGITAQFSIPFDVATDNAGNVFVADTGNNKIRKITPAGVVTTIAGIGSSGDVNGVPTSAQFNSPSSIAVDNTGIIYVGDVFNRKLKTIGEITTLSGIPTATDPINNPVVLEVTDGKVSPVQQSFTILIPETIPPTATAFSPADDEVGITNITSLEITLDENIVAGTGNVTIYDASDDSILETIDVNSLAVSVLANKTTISTSLTRIPGKTYYILIDAGAFKDVFDNNFAGISDKTTWNFTINNFYPTFNSTSGSELIFAGDDTKLSNFLVVGLNIKWYANATGGSALTANATSVTDNSTFYVTQDVSGTESARLAVSFKRVSNSLLNATARGELSEITPLLSLRTNRNPKWFANSSGGSALSLTNTFITASTLYLEEETSTPTTTVIDSGINFISKIAVDSNDNIYVTETGLSNIGKMDASGNNLTTIGSGFSSPNDIFIDSNDNIFILDNGNNAVKKMDTSGNNIVTINNSFSGPSGMALDAAGNIYVSESNNNRIIKIDASGTILNTFSVTGNPSTLDIDTLGNIYFTDNLNDIIYRIDANGANQTIIFSSTFSYFGDFFIDASNTIFFSIDNEVKTMANSGGFTQSFGTGFSFPNGLVKDSSGNLLVITSANSVKKIQAPLTANTSSNRVAVNLNLINTFTGNDTSFPTQWRRNSNWSRLQTPISTEDVAIPSGKNAEISVFDAQANNLTVQGTLTVKNGLFLEVNNNLETTGTLLVESDDERSGIITVANTATGNITYERQDILQNEWNLFTTPVQGETVLSFAQNTQNDIRVNTTVTPNRYALGFYNDAKVTGTKWEYYTANTPVNTNLDFGKGYAVSRNANGSLFFTGTLLNSNLDIGIKANEWNAVGNSHLAYFPVNGNSSNNFLTDNVLTLGIPSVFVWSANQNKYASYSNLVSSDDLTLLPAQGFFVRGTTTNTVVSLPKSRTLTALSFGGESKQVITSDIPYIKLYASKETITVNTDIIFSKTATNGFDAQEDIENFGGAAFDINTHLLEDSEGKDFTVQSIAKNKTNVAIIPISIHAAKGDVVSLSVKMVDFVAGTKVHLEDKEENTFTELTSETESYKITVTEAINGIGRFYLHTNSSVLSTNIVDASYLSIYLFKGNTLKISGLNQLKTTISIFDILGKQIFTDSISGEHIKDIQLNNLSKTVYVVKLTNKNGSISKKIIIE